MDQNFIFFSPKMCAYLMLFRGGSTTCCSRGSQPSGLGRRPNIFNTFPEKPYEIKEILVCKGGGGGAGSGPLDPSLLLTL